MITINQILNPKGNIDISTACQAILNTNRIRGTNNRLYIWKPNKCCYEHPPDERRAVYEMFAPECQLQLSSHQIDEILRRLKSLPQTSIEADEFDNNPEIINCKNGILNLNTLKFIQINEECNFTGQLDFNYISDATIEKAPIFKKFTDTSLCEDVTKRKYLLQITGYNISNDFSLKTACCLSGAPDSGKTHILKLVSKVWGDSRVSNLTLSDLGKRFSTSQLAFTHLNVNGDLETDVLHDVATFKRLLGGDRIFAEYKGQDGFMFTPRLHLLYACNNLPMLKEVQKSDAYINRISLLHFPISVPKEQQDPQLFQKLWEERDIIFSLAINEFSHMMATTRTFDVDKDSAIVLQRYKDTLNPVGAFIRDMCILGENHSIHKNIFYNAFYQWCEENEFTVKISKHDISQLVLKTPKIHEAKFRQNGSTPMHGFKGIKLKDGE